MNQSSSDWTITFLTLDMRLLPLQGAGYNSAISNPTVEPLATAASRPLKTMCAAESANGCSMTLGLQLYKVIFA
jgi:hypothetical protein